MSTATPPEPSRQTPGENQAPDFSKEKLLDRQDILQLFYISESTLKNWHRKGILPHSKIGGKCYYRPKDIEEMLQNNRRPKTS